MSKEVIVPPRRAPNEVTNKLDVIARSLGDGDEAFFLLTISSLFDKFPGLTFDILDQMSNY